jgi:hypothetical protein
MGLDRRTWVGAIGHLPVFVLAADAERQDGKKHRPPDHEIDRYIGKGLHYLGYTL